MGEVTNEQVNLMLRLFEERREPRLREAREWFSANFHVKTQEDLMRTRASASALREANATPHIPHTLFFDLRR